jgi:hypothetical protein
MNPELLRLVREHRARGIVIDTNILLLYVVGQYDRNLIGTFKRVKSYSEQDFFCLLRFLQEFSHIITTPHILTEVTDLSGNLNKDPDYLFFEGLRDQIGTFTEQTDSSQNVCQTDGFIKFGLADAYVSELARSGELVLTDDFPLYHYLSSQGLPTINFNHLRNLDVG